MITCLICGREFKNSTGLSRHLDQHQLTIKEYYDRFFKKEGEGICQVCGKETKFISFKDGYRKYCSHSCSNKDPELLKKKVASSKQTCTEKYGVDNVSKLQNVKEKIKEANRKKYGCDWSIQNSNIRAKAKQTCLERYGVDNPAKLDSVKEKTRQTWTKRYGVDNPAKLDSVKEKTRQTWIKRYGVDSPLKNREIFEKVQQTMLKKQGVRFALQSEKCKEKFRQTCLERYGEEYYTKTQEMKEKSKETCLQRYGTSIPMRSQVVKDRLKETFIQKYGVENPLQHNEIKNRAKQTNLERYGVTCTLQNEKIKKKIEEIRYEKFLVKLKKQLEYLEFELLDERYVSSTHKHNWRCKKCGTEFRQSWNVIQQGYQCPKCFPRFRSSIGERDVYNFITNSLGLDVISNTRKIIPPLEVDIYIPEKKVAIEFNGLYWHSDDKVDKKYHLTKTLKCQEKGVRLIHIFEDEWILKEEIVKSRLRHILGVTDDLRHVYARHCIIEEIDSKTSNKFLEENHIQGPDNSVIKLGAFFEDELVAVMTFSHGSLAKGVKEQDPLVWELNRFCSRLDLILVGIAGKLLTHFKRNYQWKKIYSYADRRWSNGNMYYKLGFNLERVTTPNYWYVKGLERIHRFKLRKKPTEPKDIPEVILRVKQGYVRVWDCGSYKFALER